MKRVCDEKKQRRYKSVNVNGHGEIIVLYCGNSSDWINKTVYR